MCGVRHIKDTGCWSGGGWCVCGEAQEVPSWRAVSWVWSSQVKTGRAGSVAGRSSVRQEAVMIVTV